MDSYLFEDDRVGSMSDKKNVLVVDDKKDIAETLRGTEKTMEIKQKKCQTKKRRGK